LKFVVPGVVLAATLACNSQSLDGGGTIYFPQYSGDFYATGALHARLERAEACLLLLPEPDGQRFLAIWRDTMKPRVDGSAVRIENARGDVLATSGTLVVAGGREATPQEAAEYVGTKAPSSCRGINRFFLVGTISHT